MVTVVSLPSAPTAIRAIASGLPMAQARLEARALDERAGSADDGSGGKTVSRGHWERR
jgi:hypothetical protein